MSLLIVRCPPKPQSDAELATQNPDWFMSQLASFKWCLVNADGSIESHSLGSIEEMPYAERALVFISTLDVQLIEIKLPLVNDKKLSMVLPGLLEEQLLGGLKGRVLRLFPQSSASSTHHRTVAVLDQAWLDWIIAQLAGLLPPQVTLLPDCYLLKQANTQDGAVGMDGAHASFIAYEAEDQHIVWTVRLSEYLGISWSEQNHQTGYALGELQAALPSQLRHGEPCQFAWEWISIRSNEIVKNNEFGHINLFEETLQGGFWNTKSKNNRGNTNRNGSWLDRKWWIRPERWLIMLMSSFILGYTLSVSWLQIADFRWQNAMDNLVASTESRGQGGFNSDKAGNTKLAMFIDWAIVRMRSNGEISNADFPALARDLQRLNQMNGGNLIQSLHYSGHSVVFKINNHSNGSEITPASLIRQAQDLDLSVVWLEGSYFRLSALAGLGGAQP